MATRDALLNAGRKASKVLLDFDARHRIQDGYTRIDPVAIAENAGVPVMYQYLDKLLGAFLNHGRPGILVNVARSPGLVHMTCAHELGHFFLNHEPTADIQLDYGELAVSAEQEADQFAYSLLAPQWLLVNIMKRKGWSLNSLANPIVLYQLSLRLGTSYTSIIWALVRLKFLNIDVAREVVKLQPKMIKRNLTKKLSDQEGFADVWLLDESDKDAVLEPRANDLFIFELKGTPSSGYLWSMDEIRSEGFNVNPILHDNQLEPTKQHFGKNASVGGITPLQFLVARQKDKQVSYDRRTSFSMTERRPWLSERADDPKFNFSAEYENLDVGINRLERLQLLDQVKAGA
jgi:Zn-dependent peptidase ImmA (M78 family)